MFPRWAAHVFSDGCPYIFMSEVNYVCSLVRGTRCMVLNSSFMGNLSIYMNKVVSTLLSALDSFDILRDFCHRFVSCSDDIVT